MTPAADLNKWRLDAEYGRLRKEQRDITNQFIEKARSYRRLGQELPDEELEGFEKQSMALNAKINEFNNYVRFLRHVLSPDIEEVDDTFADKVTKYIPADVRRETYKWVTEYLAHPLESSNIEEVETNTTSAFMYALKHLVEPSLTDSAGSVDNMYTSLSQYIPEDVRRSALRMANDWLETDLMGY